MRLLPLPPPLSTSPTSLLTSLTGSTYSSANACYKEAAELAAQLGQFPRAIDHFEKIASQSLSSALTRYGVKEYYLKAGLCWLATAVRFLSFSSPFSSFSPI